MLIIKLMLCIKYLINFNLYMLYVINKVLKNINIRNTQMIANHFISFPDVYLSFYFGI